MPQIVEVQGLGTVEFPDEMSPEQIKSALDDQFSQQQPAGALERGVRNFARGALGAVAAIPESVAVVADKIGREFPSIDEGKSLQELTTWKIGQAIRDAVAAPVGDKPEGIKGFLTDSFSQGAGSTVGFIAGGAAGRVAKLPAWLSVAASGAAAGGMEQFDDAMNKGADPETAWKAFLIGSGVGTSEAVPISNWLTKVDPEGRIKRALLEGAEEGIQEVFQTVAGNVTAQQMYDPNRPWLQGAGESGATGVTVGGLFSLLFSAAAGRKHTSLNNPASVQVKLENASSPETAKVVAEAAQPEAQGKQPFKGPVKEQPMPDPLAFVNDYGTPQAPQANAAIPNARTPGPERPKYIPPAPSAPVKPELNADPIDPPSPKDNIGPLTEEEKALFQAELDAELGQTDTQDDVQPEDIQPNTATAEASQAASEPLPAVETPTEASKQQDAPKAVQAEAVNQATEQASKAQKAPYITQSNVDEALQTVGEAMKGVDSKLQKLLGEFRVVRLPEGSSGLESAPRSGKNVILVDPIKLKQSIAAGLDLKTGIEEEILHNATGQVVERMRQATAPNVPFRAFWDVTMNRIAEEMSKDLRQNVQRVYGAKLENTQLAAEYVRRLLQKRLGLSQTEQNYVREKSPILKRLLESLKELFRNTFGQTIESASARQMVTQIESLIGETQNGQPNIRADAGGNAPTGQVNGSSPEVYTVSGVQSDAQGSVPQGEAGSGTESGRGQIFEPDRYPDIQLSEDWEKKLHKEVALYVAKNPQISAGDQPAAEGYIHTRARNVAKAWVKDYGSLEAKDASGDKFKLGMVISSRGTNFFNKTQNQKSGGTIQKASLDAEMGEDGDTTMHDMVAAPEESEAVRIVREAAALLSKDAKKMYDVAIQDTTNEWMDEWAKQNKTTKRKVKAEWEGIQQSLAKIIAQQGFLPGSDIDQGDRVAAAPPQPGGLNVNKDWDADAKARELTTGQKAARFFKQNKWGAVGYLEDIANRTKNQMAKAAIQKLAKAIPTQLEITAALHGDLDKDFARFENTHTKARQAEVYSEVSRWVAVAQARGTEAAPIKADDAWNDAMNRIYPTLSPEAKSLVDTVQKLGVKKGSIMERLGVQVQEGGKWRPAQNLKEKYWPRIIKEEVRIIFGDPEANAETFAKYNALLDQMVAEYPKRFKDRETADAFITQSVKQSVAEGDFYAGAELARGEKLPDSFYDYTLDGYRQANEHFSKRMGQISAYGQSTDDQLDLWQQVEKIATRQGTNESGDRSLKQSLEILRAEMYGTHQHDWSKNTRRFIMAIATVRYLSATATLIRNVAGSLVNTSENLGVWNTIKASTIGLMESYEAIQKSIQLGRLVEPASVEKAAAIGVLQRSLYFARMFDVDIAETGKFKRIMDAILLPNQLAEQWNRGVNFTAAQMWLKGAVESIKADPTSYISRARRAQLERWGFTGQKLDALVKGNPSAVKSFLRKAVKEKQYGYSLDQVPVIFNSSIGKFMLQFQRWGAQRTRDMARNILIPAVVGENVDGKKVRNVAPLLRFVVGSLATTAAIKVILEAAFDRKDIQRTWDEVFNSLDKDTKQGVADAISKVLLDLTATGAAGVIPDYLRAARDAIEGGRQKSLSEPPGIAIANDIKDLVTATYQRKGDPQGFVRDLIQILVKRTPLAKEFDDAQMKWLTSGTDRAKQNRARNQVRLMKALVNRYAEEKGLEKLQSKRGFQGTKTENSETMDQLYEALLIGDTQAAAKIRREYAVNKAKLQGLMRSVQSRNPLGLMAAKSQRGARQDFLVWLRERRPDAVSSLVQLEAVYERTARQVGLLR